MTTPPATPMLAILGALLLGCDARTPPGKQSAQVRPSAESAYSAPAESPYWTPATQWLKNAPPIEPGNRTFARLSEEEAIQRAAESLGLEEYDKTKVSASVVVLSEESLPYVGDRVAGLESWRIEFDAIRLHAKKRDALLLNPHVTKLIVYLGPWTGQVIRVVSPWPEGLRPRLRYPLVENEGKPGQRGAWYAGIPGEPPGVTLLDALSKADYWSSEVKQIVAVYVWHHSDFPHYDDHSPAWVIHCLGIPQMASGSTPAPADFVGGKTFDASPVAPPQITRPEGYHWVDIINARTGEQRFGYNVPVAPENAPHPPVEERY